MYHSKPLPIQDIVVTDAFWASRQELVRTAVIPYQWQALNDNVPGAAPSYCMHNFRAAVRQRQQAKQLGEKFTPPHYTFRGFEALPDDPAHPDPDKFYGFVFQDTDFSKWIEAVGYSLANHPDSQLEQLADGAIDIVCQAQLDNGYLDTYYIVNGMDKSFTNLKDHHELYCLGHLIEGAVAYWQGTGKDALLKAACRFADYVDNHFGGQPGKLRGYPGHEIAEMALVRLYEATGEERYLSLAEYFIRERGSQPLYFEQEEKACADEDGVKFVHNDNLPAPYAYYQAHVTVVEQDEAVGHAVRAGYLYSGLADVARLREDADLQRAARALWRNIVDKKLYITGGIGATHLGEAFSFNYDLPNDTAYSETCAAIALAFFARRMLQIEPKREYADVMEQALVNTVLAGMAADGKSFFYVNPLEVDPKACRQDARKFHVKPVRQRWFGCACCPPNIARIVESIQEYAVTVNEEKSTLFMHLYIGSHIKAQLANGEIGLTVISAMPWQGVATLQVDLPNHAPNTQGEITLALRLPSWAGPQARHAVTMHSGDAVTDDTGDASQTDNRFTYAERDGYLYITGVWQDGDTITLDFDMPVRMVAANTQVREDIGKVAFTRGAVTYCAESVDNGDNLHLLSVDAAAIAQNPDCVQVTFNADFAVGSHGEGETREGQVDSVTLPIVELNVPGWRILQDNSQELYHSWEPASCEETTVRLIPYFMWANRGCGEMSVWLRTSSK